VRNINNPRYLQNAYNAAAEIYHRLGNSDSFYRYQRLYEELHDAEEKKVADARLGIARIKLDNLKNELVIENLSRERKSEELKRNAIIAGLILLSIIAILYVNGLRLKLRHKVELAMEQKKTAEAEIQTAKEKLELFTRNIMEKSDLIDRLQQQATDKEFNSAQQQLIDELIHQTILTEGDWEKFKNIFDKIYPGFFRRLKEKASDITVAEQRMAALTRLQLETRQIASMLGISVDSVHKSRQRLRQRFNFSFEADLKDFLARL
jgi:DNA-binding CsgD family transcriptional regulator